MVHSNAATDIEETLAAPLGEMIAAVGRGIADAQSALDAQTMQRFKDIYQADSELQHEMRRLGFMPTWYRIPEAEAELTLSLSVGAHSQVTGTTGNSGASAPGGIRLFAAPVDASYANKYDFKMEAVSKIKFKIVAVPPSPQAEQTRVVPSGLIGKTFRQAKALLDEWEIPHTQAGKGSSHPEALYVEKVEPPSGQTLKPGQPVILTLK